MKHFLKFIFNFTLIWGTICAAQTPAPVTGNTPVPNTYVSTGFVSNYSAPYHPAPFGSYGMLVNSNTSSFPTYLGFSYELYLDATGKPAYGGLATIRTIIWKSGRWFAFGTTELGGAGSVSSISSNIKAGGGLGVILTKVYSDTKTPHWEAFVEPEAQRIPALANGVNAALKVGISYSFNRPSGVTP
jgi:hypothetical protein